MIPPLSCRQTDMPQSDALNDIPQRELLRIGPCGTYEDVCATVGFAWDSSCASPPF